MLDTNALFAAPPSPPGVQEHRASARNSGFRGGGDAAWWVPGKQAGAAQALCRPRGAGSRASGGTACSGGADTADSPRQGPLGNPTV